MADPLHRFPFADYEVKGTYGTHGHTSLIVADFAAPGDFRFHDVPGLKALDDPLPFGSCARETVPIHPAHLPRLSAKCFNEKWGDGFDVKGLRGRSPNASSIKPVRFWQFSPDPVVPGASPCCRLHGKTEGLQAMEQFPAGRIDGSCILERRFRLSQYPLKNFWLILEEVFDELCSLFVVARLAGKGEVAYAVTSSSCATQDVLDFQRYVRRPTVSTLSPPFLQQVLADFVSDQLPLLILHPADFRILHGLCVKFYQFLRKRNHRTISAQAAHPGQGVSEAAL